MSQVWMITGSSRGLGRQIATAALDAGHSVVVTARNADRLADLEEPHGDRVLPVQLDVTDPVAAQQAVERATEHFGTLDVVVNNAGQADCGSIEDTPLELFAFADRLANNDGNQPGDPRRAAAVIVRVAQMSEPPERLILGTDALTYAERAARELADSDAMWRDISTSIDFSADDTAR